MEPLLFIVLFLFFKVYNPYLEHMPRRTPKVQGFKFYDIDGMGPNTPARYEISIRILLYTTLLNIAK